VRLSGRGGKSPNYGQILPKFWPFFRQILRNSS
jgi:hypothetical protein